MGKTIQITTLDYQVIHKDQGLSLMLLKVSTIGTLFIKAQYSKKNRDQHLIFGGNYADDSGKAYDTCIK